MMAVNTAKVLAMAEGVLAAQELEVAAGRARRPMLVVCRMATGTGHIDHAFALDGAFRVVFVRCHFTGTLARNAFVLSGDSGAGSAFDTELFSIRRAGVGRDVNFRLTAEESAEPSAWTFQPGDALRVRWTNPDVGNITWGLEVGLAAAS